MAFTETWNCPNEGCTFVAHRGRGQTVSAWRDAVRTIQTAHAATCGGHSQKRERQ